MIKNRDQFHKYLDNNHDEQKLYEAIKHLSDIVIRKHYSNISERLSGKDDLRSECYVAIMEALEAGELDRDRDPIPYLYQACRNKIHSVMSKASVDITYTSDLPVADRNVKNIKVEDKLEDIEGLFNGNEPFKEHLKGMLVFKKYLKN